MGRHSESEAILRDTQVKYADRGAYSIAQSYGLRNDKEAAFEWLNHSFKNRESGILWIRSVRSFRELHGDPRYKTLLHKLNLPQ